MKIQADGSLGGKEAGELVHAHQRTTLRKDKPPACHRYLMLPRLSCSVALPRKIKNKYKIQPQSFHFLSDLRGNGCGMAYKKSNSKLYGTEKKAANCLVEGQVGFE